MKTIAEIRAMKESDLKRLVRMVMVGFDQTGRSIAKANIKMALKERNDTAWVFGKVRSPMLSDKRVKKEIADEIKRWGSRMRCHEKKTVIMEYQAVATATKSTMHELNNTEEMSKRRRSEHKCE